jgi:hypothetical protein
MENCTKYPNLCIEEHIYKWWDLRLEEGRGCVAPRLHKFTAKLITTHKGDLQWIF